MTAAVVVTIGICCILLIDCIAHAVRCKREMLKQAGEVAKACESYEQQALERLYAAYQVTAEYAQLQIALKMMADDMLEYADERWDTPEECIEFFMLPAYKIVQESQEWGKKFEKIRIEPVDE